MHVHSRIKVTMPPNQIRTYIYIYVYLYKYIHRYIYDICMDSCTVTNQGDDASKYDQNLYIYKCCI